MVGPFSLALWNLKYTAWWQICQGVRQGELVERATQRIKHANLKPAFTRQIIYSLWRFLYPTNEHTRLNSKSVMRPGFCMEPGHGRNLSLKEQILAAWAGSWSKEKKDKESKVTWSLKPRTHTQKPGANSLLSRSHGSAFSRHTSSIWPNSSLQKQLVGC